MDINVDNEIEESICQYIGSEIPLPSYLECGICKNKKPGVYYPRIYRPGSVTTINRDLPNCIDSKAMFQSYRALEILLNGFHLICNTVELHESNFDTYGHEIRNLLLISCMEFESAAKAILEGNQYKSKSNNFLNTGDYVKLMEPLDLASYKVKNIINDIEIVPFKGWDKQCPSESLSWYTAYNKTKHNREIDLKEATLENLFYSIGAVIVMNMVQFHDYELGMINKIEHFIVSRDKEFLAEDFYIPLKSGEWKTESFNFD